jgi:hypothetical protein
VEADTAEEEEGADIGNPWLEFHAVNAPTYEAMMLRIGQSRMNGLPPFEALVMLL